MDSLQRDPAGTRGGVVSGYFPVHCPWELSLLAEVIRGTGRKSHVDSAAMPNLEDQNGHGGIGYPSNRPADPNAIPPQTGKVAGQRLPSRPRIFQIGDVVFEKLKNAPLPRSIDARELLSRAWGTFNASGQERSAVCIA